MELYHGSIEEIKQPRILEKQRLLDFGKGFYVTTSKEQAERWARIKQQRNGKNSFAIVNVYQAVDELLNNEQLKINIFTEASEEWFDFVIFNRNNNTPHAYDIVLGPVANDTLYQTLTLFETGILTKPETIARLKVHKLFDQMAFTTDYALSFLTFIKAYKVK